MACVIAAPSSGSGKTLLSIMISSWASSKGLICQTFKIGPDFLDPQFLSATSERPCINLDPILTSHNWIRKSFSHYGGSADIALIEGVMGLFDGLGSSETGSTAEVASSLNLPIVLVIDGSKQAASIAALVNGFISHDSSLEIAGIVLNRIKSIRHKELLIEVLSRINVKTIGCIPFNKELTIDSNYLGLNPINEITSLNSRIKYWAQLAETNLDIEYLLKLLKPPKIDRNPIDDSISKQKLSKDLPILPIALAEDKAFHFKYQETIYCLEKLKMPFVKWQPIKNEPVPKIAKAIIIPGGFPEKYAEELSNCYRSINSLKECFNKLPLYTECGGMLFLGKELKNIDGKIFPMVGKLPFRAEEGKLNVGYRKLKGLKDSLLINKEEELFGHEFHKWKIIENNKFKSENNCLNNSINSIDNSAIWEVSGWNIKSSYEGWSNKLIHSSWIHLHLPSKIKTLLKFRKAIESTIK